MSQDLTNKKIKNTYQKVVQAYPSPTGSADVELYDLVGNKIDNLRVANISGSFSGSIANTSGVNSDTKCFNIAMSIALG